MSQFFFIMVMDFFLLVDLEDMFKILGALTFVNK